MLSLRTYGVLSFHSTPSNTSPMITSSPLKGYDSWWGGFENLHRTVLDPWIQSERHVSYNQYRQVAYPDAMSFKPERFLTKDGTLDPTVRNPMSIAFGFGKRCVSSRRFIICSALLFIHERHWELNVALGRKCPGRDIAYATIWNTVAAVLTLFDIGPWSEEDGMPIYPSGEFTNGPLV